MNQILSTENNKQKQKNNFNSLIDMKKIIIIFSVLIIVFGLVIASTKIYNLIKNKNKNIDSPEVVLNKPQISIEETGGNICVLKVSYDEGLEEVSYWWNEENVRKRSLNGQTEPFGTNIEIPQGEQNVLHVKAVGIDNSVETLDYRVGSQDEIGTTDKIDIQWFHDQATNEITIVARSSKGLKELTYQWEGEEKQTVESSEENERELKAVIATKRGTNKIFISATDIDGNEQTKEQNIIGALQPEIKMVLENGETLKITVQHDMGFKKVTIKINGQEMVYDETNPQYSIETKELKIDVPVKPGKLEVSISVYTMEQPEQEYKKSGSINI